MTDNYYNDPRFSYLQYWDNRQYEHLSELIALDKLLGEQKFDHIVDLGGGYGRLVPYLFNFGNNVTLIEPSSKQRRFARTFLPKNTPVNIVSGTATKSSLETNSQDLVILVRVIHHLIDLTPVFTEIHKILKKDGLVVFEFANSLNFKSRLRSKLNNIPISKFPTDMRSPQNQNSKTIAFLNHHPETIFKSLKAANFTPIKILSVSNFRNPLMKKFIPLPVLLFLEKFSQSLLSSLYYGPSIFVLARKNA